MSRNITPSEILIRVQRQFGDESGVQVTADDVVRWINDALREAELQNPKLRQTTMFKDSVAGQQFFWAASTAAFESPIRINSVYALAGDGNYYKLTYLTLQEMDTYIDGWYESKNTGLPQVYTYEWAPTNQNAFFIRVYPAPETSRTNGFKVNYDESGAVLNNFADILDIPAYYFTYLLEYCLMKAYELDEDWEVADRKAQYIQSTLSLLANHEVMGADFYPSIMALPEDL
jgi:Family of unknown function (DUF6682)